MISPPSSLGLPAILLAGALTILDEGEHRALAAFLNVQHQAVDSALAFLDRCLPPTAPAPADVEGVLYLRIVLMGLAAAPATSRGRIGALLLAGLSAEEIAAGARALLRGLELAPPVPEERRVIAGSSPSVAAAAGRRP